MLIIYCSILFTMLLLNCETKDNSYKHRSIEKIDNSLQDFDYEKIKASELQYFREEIGNRIFPNPPTSDELIRERGYPCEIHDIVTEDGYILRVFRIPYGRRGLQNKNRSRPPLYLQHGVFCSSDCWLLSDPSKALGFRLADEGYDVWVGNSRGSTYSMNHTTLSIDDPKYWNFSLHEIGTKDLPAVIDYILYNTEYSKLTYVGHSQGTTIFFIMAASRPEYNNKILVMSALAPVVFLDHLKSPYWMLVHLGEVFGFIADELHIYDLLHHKTFMDVVDHLLCRPDSPLQLACDSILYFMFGMDSPQLNKTLVEVMLDYVPAGSSVKQLVHFTQFTKGRFAMFDYGSKGNMIEYHSITPPKYNLSAISAPVVLYYGMHDNLAPPKEVEKLLWLLPNLVGMIRVPYKLFNHIDFMWAIDVNQLLYNKAIYIMKQFLLNNFINLNI